MVESRWAMMMRVHFIPSSALETFRWVMLSRAEVASWFARHTMTYDDERRPVREEYLDEDLALTANAEGYAVIEREFDENGKPTVEN